MTKRPRFAASPRPELLESRVVLSYSPAQLTHAYGLDAVSFSSGGSVAQGTGAGQTIALIDVDHDANIAAELQTFDAQYGLPSPALTVDNQAGSTTDAYWSEEEALDVEWAHAVAPGANILVVEAASTAGADIVAAVNAAKNTPGVSVVSMSFGAPEFASETQYDSVFTTPSGHTGITFLASTGDNGAGVEWPAASPNVVAVGGTTLNLDSSNNRTGESAWSGSGNGFSAFEAEPSYQTQAQSTGKRGVPDVAIDADPATGVMAYSVANGGWVSVGGTSLSAPLWAGLIGLADQGHALNGMGTLDGPSQTLPDLYSAPAGSFNTITSGGQVTAGYNSSTGLGSPNAPTLVAALAGNASSRPINPGTTYQATPSPGAPATPPAPTPPTSAPPTPTAPTSPPTSKLSPPRAATTTTTTTATVPAGPISTTQLPTTTGKHHVKAKKSHSSRHAHAVKVAAHLEQVGPTRVATTTMQAGGSGHATTRVRVGHSTHLTGKATLHASIFGRHHS